MKREQLLRYFKKIKEATMGDNTSCEDIIDYENGNSITIDEIEEAYFKYLELQDEIDEYIEDNDLDDVINKDEIIEHFRYQISEDLFMSNQACLENFEDYMTTIIKKQNENIRKANVIFGKNGNGFLSTKITLPVPWVKQMGLTEVDKEVRLEFDGNKIEIFKID